MCLYLWLKYIPTVTSTSCTAWQKSNNNNNNNTHYVCMYVVHDELKRPSSVHSFHQINPPQYSLSFSHLPSILSIINDSIHLEVVEFVWSSPCFHTGTINCYTSIHSHLPSLPLSYCTTYVLHTYHSLPYDLLARAWYLPTYISRPWYSTGHHLPTTSKYITSPYLTTATHHITPISTVCILAS